MYRSFLPACALATALAANAQQTVHQVLVLNEGYYDNTAHQQVVPVTLGSYDPVQGTYQTVDTIQHARFGNHLLVDGNTVYVAADSLLLKYDADNYTLLGQTIVHGIRRFAIWNDAIVCTQGEVGGLPHYCEVRDKNTLELLYSVPLSALPYSCEGVQVADNKAYLAVSNAFDWQNTVGKVGIIDLVNSSYSGSVDLGPDGLNPETVMVTDDAILTFNNKDFSGSSVSRIARSNGTFTYTNNVAMNSGCGSTALVSDRIYYMEYAQNRLARYDIGAAVVLDTLANSLATYGLIDDPIDRVMYGTTTDYVSTGTLHVLHYDGTEINSVPVSVSPGRLALDVRSTTAIAERNIEKPRVIPNPATDAITVDLSGPDHAIISIVDALGRAVAAVQRNNGGSTRIDVSALAPGLYTVLANGEGTRFIKR